ncbi:MAG: hypothetical protein JZD40_01510 [Sulfolobus sp.]|nr:hypothetical protein [Sulfolobus sp.]
MVKYGDVNITRLAKLTRLRYDTLKKELDFLAQYKIIEIIGTGRAKVIKLNYTNPKVIILKNLIEELESLDRS